MGFYCRDCGKDVDEKQSDQTMSDTPRMDSAFNQPTSTTPERNWQLDQCYREGCKFERELAAVTEQRDRLAGELKEAQDAIEMMLNDSACRRIAAYTEEQLAAVKGGSDD
jgi:hypothetical protein